jgi:hypothetical protein
MPAFSADTLRLFQQLLDNVTLSAGAPDFAKAAESIVKAREELDAAVAAAAESAGTDEPAG